MSDAGALLFPQRIGVEYIARVSLTALGTRLYKRAGRFRVCLPGFVCPACDTQWYEGTLFCLNANCTVVREAGAVRDELAALPNVARDQRLADRYGITMNDVRVPGDKLPLRGKRVRLSTAPVARARAAAQASGSFTKAFPAAAAASSANEAKTAGKGAGKTKPTTTDVVINSQPGSRIVQKRSQRTDILNWRGHVHRFDNDSLYRLDMEAQGYPEILHWNNGQPLVHFQPEDAASTDAS